MGDWCTAQHGKSGLTERVRQSEITVAQAEAQTIAFLQQYVPVGKSPLCGNSICQDRRFLYRYMPTLNNYFHYRHLDVSTLKIVAQRWAPSIATGLIKDSTHVALQDFATPLRNYAIISAICFMSEMWTFLPRIDMINKIKIHNWR